MDLFDMVFVEIMAAQQMIVLIIGLVMFLIGAALLYDVNRFKRKAYRTTARVVGLRVDQGENGALYYPVVEYGARNGATVRAECDTGSSAYISKVPGTRLKIYVDSETPEKFRLPGYTGLVIGLFLTGIGAGACYFAVAVFSFSVFTPVVGILFLMWGFFKIKKNIKPRAEWESLAQFKARSTGRLIAAREALPMLDKDDVRQVQKNNDRDFARFGWISMVIGIGLCAAGLYMGQALQDLTAHGLSAPGRVLRMESSSDTDGTSYRAVVRFENAQGREVVFRDNIGTNPPSHKSGEAVRVLYREDEPESARIDRGIWNWALPGGLFGLGVLFLGGLAAQYFTVRRRMARR